MRTIKIMLADLQLGESPATAVQLYQAAMPGDEFTLIDQVQITELDEVDGYLIWPSVADPDQYLKVATISASNPLPRFFGQILGPIAQALSGTTLSIDLVALGLEPQSGVVFRAEMASVPIVIDGILIDPRPIETVTDSNGRASLLVPQNATIKVKSRALRVPVIIKTQTQAFIDIADTI